MNTRTQSNHTGKKASHNHNNSNDGDGHLMSLPTNNDFHVIRKLWHVLGGVLLVWGYWQWWTWPQACAYFGAFLVGISLFEGLKMAGDSWFKRFALRVAGPLLRRHEVSSWSGSFYFALGAFVCVLVFPKPVAILSLLYLSCADPFASTIGILIPNHFRLNNGKSFLAALLAALLSFTITFCLLHHTTPALPTSLTTERDILVISLVGAIVAAVSEAAVSTSRPRPFLADDNFLIPVISGLSLQCTLYLLHISPHFDFRL
eukprot:TRINITY_DN14270_c0_g1_i1.p1 TRINITY_DN14270_c0_g1~~TRINITY_DN14270_c0_g1_i1.p1  ORF type:complete len:260 (+),score=42.60 TRINITY_DN14270_c0_g1_i1:3-782(+)